MNITPGTIAAMICLGLVINTVVVVYFVKHNAKTKDGTDEEKDDSDESYY